MGLFQNCEISFFRIELCHSELCPKNPILKRDSSPAAQNDRSYDKSMTGLMTSL